MADIDIAMQNFTMNTLRGMGTGGGIGAGGSFVMFADKEYFKEMQQNIEAIDAGFQTFGKLLKGMQAQAQQFNIASVAGGINVIPQFQAGKKLPNVFGKK